MKGKLKVKRENIDTHNLVMAERVRGVNIGRFVIGPIPVMGKLLLKSSRVTLFPLLVKVTRYF
jgi:hypothetical protein